MSCKECCDIRNIALDAFCEFMCHQKPPRKTCTSLGTCDQYDEFNRLLAAGVRDNKMICAKRTKQILTYGKT